MQRSRVLQHCGTNSWSQYGRRWEASSLRGYWLIPSGQERTMQDAMEAVGKMNKSIKTLGKKNTTKHLSSSGQELADLVKQATNKSLKRPDADLNQQVISLRLSPQLYPKFQFQIFALCLFSLACFMSLWRVVRCFGSMIRRELDGIWSGSRPDFPNFVVPLWLHSQFWSCRDVKEGRLFGEVFLLCWCLS